MPSKALYELAAAFRRTRLWDILDETDLFAVQYPDGEYGYCCVMGHVGQHFALAVYPGNEGLSSLIALRGLPEGATPYQRFEAMHSLRGLQCSFETLDTLGAADLNELKRYALHFEGSHAWPQFRRYQPGALPWFLDAPDEARLHLALSAGIALAERIPVGFSGGEDLRQEALLSSLGFGPDILPLLSQDPKGGFTFSQITVPESLLFPQPSPGLSEPSLIARLREQTTLPAAQWFCSLAMIPMPTEGTPPMFPTALLVVDPTEGVLCVGAVLDYDENHAQLLDPLVDLLLEKGKPSQLITDDVRTYVLLRRFCGQIGQSIAYDEDIPGMDEMRNEVAMDMASDRRQT